MSQVLLLPVRESAPVRVLRPVPPPAPPPPRHRHPALGRTGRIVARTLVVLLALIAPLAAFAGQRHVSMDIEGHVKSLRTYAVTATQLLERQGVHVHKADLVLPTHRLRDGDRIVYRKAKPLRIVIDGQRRRVIARGLTVGEALHDLGLEPGPNDHVYPDPSTRLTPSTTIYVRNAIHAVVRVDGLRRDVVSSADTVRHLLEQANIAVGPHDYVFPSPSAVPTDGIWIRVVRVQYINENVDVPIPYSYITRHDSSMDSGTSEVVQQGAEGLEVDTYSVLLEDGQRVSSSLVGAQTVRSAQDYIVRVGTKPPVYTSHGASEEGDASWFAADGMVAAHRTLPIGSTVKVTNLATGQSVIVTINQRGPYVDGRVIDLSNEAFSQLAPLGAGTIKVRVDE